MPSRVSVVAGSPGTPQKVTWLPRSCPASEALLTLTVTP